MSVIKSLVVLLFLALMVSMSACATTYNSKSGSSSQSYGVQGGYERGGTGPNWTNYWGP
jgi:hypothetical protein